ncbi:hypothetical protein BSLG_008074 [Batrachochytrium salamandrivorans]|nr:hypothetical protein BSLG_008074 [Batrachochytrium salamandrivorans]
MIYTSYTRIAIIVALMSASVATPVAQDQASAHLEKRAPPVSDDVSGSQQQGRRPKAALMPPGWTRHSTDQNQVSPSSQVKLLPPRLIRQFTSQQPPHQSQVSPLSKSTESLNSPRPLRRSKVDRPLPGWTKQSSHPSQFGSSQAARPIHRLTRRPTPQKQASSSQIEPPAVSNSDFDMPTEQDPATSHASPGGVEDDEISSPESSAGGSRRTSPKKTTLKPQSKLDCRVSSAEGGAGKDI